METISDLLDGKLPLNQFLASDLVMLEMAEVGADRAMRRTVSEVIVLSMLAGGEALLDEIVASKMRYREIGGVEGWFQGVLSGVLGNFLVGMAAFLAVMGRTIIGKYIPVLLTVSAFVAAGFMHSPANMAYISLATPEGTGLGPALAWSIAPAALGNILGAFFLVALPFWMVNTRRQRSRAETPAA